MTLEREARAARIACERDGMRTTDFAFVKLSLVPLSGDLRGLRHVAGTGWAGPVATPVTVEIALAAPWTLAASGPALRAVDSAGDAVDLTVDGTSAGPGGAGVTGRLSLSWPPMRTVRVIGSPDGGAAQDLFLVRPDTPFANFIPETVQRLARTLGITRWPTFVETGTLFAHTAVAMAPLFEHVYSVELSDEIHDRARAIQGLPDNVTFLKGDSAAVLADLVPRIEGPAVFFLDAHWSGPAGTDDRPGPFRGYPLATAHRGMAAEAPPASAQLPVRDEIETILTRFEDAAILIVDDWPAIGAAGVGWPTQDWTNVAPADLVDLLARSGRLADAAPIDQQRWSFALQPRSSANP